MGTYLVTAGPTYEKIDPVRFIGNFSTGKMGYAMAEALAKKGHAVILVSGSTQLTASHPNITQIDVLSAEEMLKACLLHFKKCDGAFFVAAVSDYRPAHFSPSKIKKEAQTRLTLELMSNPDIAQTLGQIKKSHQQTIGFALETENEAENALAKMKKKNFDYIVLNSLQDEGAGFGHDTNKVTLFGQDGTKQEMALNSKTLIAKELVNIILNQ